MAKLLMGAIVTKAVGKLNGHCFRLYGSTQVLQRNPLPARVSVISKNRAIPKAQMGFSSWSTISESERNLWNAIAVDNPVLDRFGNPKTLSGRSFYCRIYINLATAGFGMVEASNFNSKVPSCSFTELQVSQTDGTITYLDYNFEEGGILVVSYEKVRGTFNHPNPNKIKFGVSIQTGDYEPHYLWDTIYYTGTFMLPSQYWAFSTCVISPSGIVSPKILSVVSIG